MEALGQGEGPPEREALPLPLVLPVAPIALPVGAIPLFDAHGDAEGEMRGVAERRGEGEGGALEVRVALTLGLRVAAPGSEGVGAPLPVPPPMASEGEGKAEAQGEGEAGAVTRAEEEGEAVGKVGVGVSCAEDEGQGERVGKDELSAVAVGVAPPPGLAVAPPGALGEKGAVLVPPACEGVANWAREPDDDPESDAIATEPVAQPLLVAGALAESELLREELTLPCALGVAEGEGGAVGGALSDFRLVRVGRGAVPVLQRLPVGAAPVAVGAPLCTAVGVDAAASESEGGCVLVPGGAAVGVRGAVPETAAPVRVASALAVAGGVLENGGDREAEGGGEGVKEGAGERESEGEGERVREGTAEAVPAGGGGEAVPGAVPVKAAEGAAVPVPPLPAEGEAQKVRAAVAEIVLDGKGDVEAEGGALPEAPTGREREGGEEEVAVGEAAVPWSDALPLSVAGVDGTAEREGAGERDEEEAPVEDREGRGVGVEAGGGGAGGPGGGVRLTDKRALAEGERDARGLPVAPEPEGLREFEGQPVEEGDARGEVEEEGEAQDEKLLGPVRVPPPPPAETLALPVAAGGVGVRGAEGDGSALPEPPSLLGDAAPEAVAAGPEAVGGALPLPANGDGVRAGVAELKPAL